MPFKSFTIPVTSPEAAENDLNSFLASHRVLSVERRWIEAGTNSFLWFCIEYHTPRGSPSEPRANSRSNTARVDYREVLSPEDFAVFAKLRDVRKEIATAEAVPAYMVFTNEQLAQVVKTRVATKSDLAKISGPVCRAVARRLPLRLEPCRRFGIWSSPENAEVSDP